MKHLFALLLTTSALSAQSLPEGVADIRLLEGWREGDVHHAALAITLVPGWHTYWRVPGEAGIPPVFAWNGSTNLERVGISWPSPSLFDQNGMTSIGYEGTLILPLDITPTDAGAAVRLEAQIEIGVCKDICMPFAADVFADLPAGGEPDPLIRAARAGATVSGVAAGVGTVTCSALPIEDGLRVTSRITWPGAGGREHVVLELPGSDVWISDAKVTRDGGDLVAVADMVPPSGAPFALERSGVRITILAGGQALNIDGCTGG
jgi:Disulphide bond corrector protein DsbC